MSISNQRVIEHLFLRGYRLVGKLDATGDR